MKIRECNRAQEQGFSMPEILAVLVILSVLAAIAVPTVLSQRSKGVEASITTDAAQVGSALASLDNAWRNKPPGQVGITTASGQWKALIQGQTIASDSGPMSNSNVATGTMWTNGSYCVQVTSPSSSKSAVYRSDQKSVQLGTATCPGSALDLDALPTVNSQVAVAPAPKNPSASVSAPNTVLVSWTAVSGATGYLVSIPGSAQATGAGAATSCSNTATCNQPVWSGNNTSVSFVNMKPGKVAVTIRATTAAGVGSSAVTTINVTGDDLSKNGLEISGNLTVENNQTVTGDTTNSNRSDITGNQMVDSGTLVKDSGWSDATYLSTETRANGGNGIQCKVFPDGIVKLRGAGDVIFAGNPGTFYLPSKCASPTRRIFSILAYSTPIVVHITGTTGYVYRIGLTGGYTFNVDGVEYDSTG